jgi:hypothetical protein
MPRFNKKEELQPSEVPPEIKKKLSLPPGDIRNGRSFNAGHRFDSVVDENAPIEELEKAAARKPSTAIKIDAKRTSGSQKKKGAKPKEPFSCVKWIRKEWLFLACLATAIIGLIICAPLIIKPCDPFLETRSTVLACDSTCLVKIGDAMAAEVNGKDQPPRLNTSFPSDGCKDYNCSTRFCAHVGNMANATYRVDDATGIPGNESAKFVSYYPVTGYAIWDGCAKLRRTKPAAPCCLVAQTVKPVLTAKEETVLLPSVNTRFVAVRSPLF